MHTITYLHGAHAPPVWPSLADQGHGVAFPARLVVVAGNCRHRTKVAVDAAIPRCITIYRVDGPTSVERMLGLLTVIA